MDKLPSDMEFKRGHIKFMKTLSNEQLLEWNQRILNPCGCAYGIISDQVKSPFVKRELKKRGLL